MNGTLKQKLAGYLPYAIGAILVVQFAALGVWQVGRGLDKRAQRAAFGGDIGYAQWTPGADVRSFQKIKVTGAYDAGHQVVLENIIINSRYGYYVLTPFVVDGGEPVLIVNRGWLERTAADLDPARVAFEAPRLTIRGRVGSLPRAGYRMGEAMNPGPDWPRTAVYPTLDEIAAALGRDVQPFVLLLDPEDDFGFLRYWVPEEMGPGRHFAYALQWFAMGIALAFLLLRNYRRRGLET